MGCLSVALASLATGAPTGGKVVGGSGTITQSGSTTDIQQATSDLSINWQSFNIASQETVNFLQPTSSAIAVNRIVGNSTSQIFGRLNANGQVYLINPNGILFGKGSQVNVGGLVASTLDIDDPNFVGSSKSFSGNAVANVINRGSIAAAPGGYVALLGKRVDNQGLISATLGTVALGAGSAVTLTFAGHSLIHMQVDRSVLGTLARNGGILKADGGQVLMTAGAKDSLMASTVNNTGLIEARTIDNHNGTITLLGGMRAGEVTLDGTLDASAPEGGNGGMIETSGASVLVRKDAKVTTAASKGLVGSWLVDPENFTVAASGGDISGATLSSELNSTSVTIQSSTGGQAGSGDINVNDAVSWSANSILTFTASNNVNINAVVTATGSAPGLIINPNTANGTDAASGGTFNLAAGAAINLPNVSPTSKTALVIAGTAFTVINAVGAPGSTTGTDLQGIAANLNGNYALGSNIDASATSGWNAGAGFAPIGTSRAPFAGTLTGLGHSINNLTINRPNDSSVGLLAYTGPTSVVENVGVGGTITGSSVGALIGTDYGMVSQSFSTAQVTGNGVAGGLIGTSYQTQIDSSYATGNVTGGSNVGGLVGYSHSNITNSHATGSVTGSSYVGGLVGYIDGNYPVKNGVTNSYATGNVSGGNNVGGLVGSAAGGYGGAISKSFATGNVSGSINVGGLLGFNGGGNTSPYYGTAGSVGDSRASGNVTGTSNVGGLVGLNAGSVGGGYASGTVSGSDAVGGLIGRNGGSFAGSQTARDIGSVGGSFATGSVSGSLNVGGLVGVNGGAAGYYGLVGTIGSAGASGSVTGTATSNNVGGLVGYSYGAIGNTSASGSVRGGTNVGGLVGSSAVPGYPNSMSASISTSYATGSVSGSSNVGGLVGSNGDVTITNSYASGSVLGTGGGVGGLVGSNTYGTDNFNTVISNSYATGNVSGGNGVGGLIGVNSGGYVVSISNAYATGNVTGSTDVGGLVGASSTYPNNSTAIIINSHASGHVIGGDTVGGLVGDNEAIIANSYATGSVSGTNQVGGLIGYSAYSGYGGKPYASVSNSYATGSVLATTSVGGLVGDNEGLVFKSYATGAVQGSNNVGGLLGYSGFKGVGADQSYAAGAVAGSNNIGGLVGSNAGAVTNSFWDTTASGQSTSAGGIGMTTIQMQSQTNFTSATAANGNLNPGWDFIKTWTMYDAYTYPLLVSFMTPLTVTANSGAVTYNGSAYTGSLGITYSSIPSSDLLGTVTFDKAINVGSYAITPGGLYSDQQGYIISYVSGSLKINQLASVSWAGGSTGNWSNPANWAGGAIPDYSNVAAVFIPTGVSVNYDSAVPGSTVLNTLTSNGNVVIAAGTLGTTGNFSTAGYQQSGGTLSVGGTLTINSAATSGVSLGNIVAGSLNLTSQEGSITQIASSALTIKGTTGLVANNGAIGNADVKYDAMLSNAGNNFVGPVSFLGSTLSLTDASGGVVLGNVYAGDALVVKSLQGTITQAVGTAITDLGASTLTADNGGTGAGDVRHSITLGNASNNFTGAVSTTGLNINLNDNGGGIVLGNTTASGVLTATSLDGAIIQGSGTAIIATGASNFFADNGLSGAADSKHSITLTNASNHFGGPVSTNGSNVSLTDAVGGLTLGKTTASSTLTVVSLNGAISQQSGSAIVDKGASYLTADNGNTGSSEVRYSIVLGNAGNDFVGSVVTRGSNIDLADSAGGLILNNTSATGTLTVDSTQGAITQKAGTGITAAGITSFVADNGASGVNHVSYNILLGNSTNKLSGSVAADGYNINLNDDSSALLLNNTTAAGTFTAASRGGSITQKSNTTMNVTGTSSFTADSETGGSNDVRYGIALANANNHFGGAVTATGDAITLAAAQALSAVLDSTGSVTLDTTGPLKVSGTIASNLTTTTTGGAASTTTFGTTTVGNNLMVTSLGAVATTTPSTALTVHGAGTHTKNSHVTVNKVVGAIIN